MEEDTFLSELGVTARGERDVARDVIRNAALAAAARAGASRGDRGDGNANDGGTEADAGGGGGGENDDSTAIDPGVAAARREAARLREEASKVAAELSAVKDALDDVRAKSADGTAPADAPLIIAVGERRIAGLRDKRDALRATIADADAALRAAARAATARAAPTSAPAPRAPAPALAEDDDLDALLDGVAGVSARNRTRAGPGPGSGSGPTAEAGETERERLIRAGVLTPFDSLGGFERRVREREATASAAATAQALREGRSRAVMLEGEDVPKQHPEARPFARTRRAHAADAGAKMAAKRREWRRAAERAGNGPGAPPRRRRRRRGDAAYSSDEVTESEEEEEEEEDEEEEDDEKDEDEGGKSPEVKVEAEEAAPAGRSGSRGSGSRARGGRARGAHNLDIGSARAGSSTFVIPKREPAEVGSATVTAAAGGVVPSRWSCPACTFANPGASANCEMCETPRAAGEPTPTIPNPSDDEDDDVVLVGEVSAPATSTRGGTARGTTDGAKGKGKKARGAGDGRGREKIGSGEGIERDSPVDFAAPLPRRRAAVAAARRAGRAAEAEADGALSGSASGSEYDEDEDKDATEDEALEDEAPDALEDEAPEEVAVAPPQAGSRSRPSNSPGAAPRGAKKPRTPRASRSRGDAPSGRGTRGGVAARAKRRRVEDDLEDEDEDEIIFDGGLRLPAATYDRLLEHQRTSIKWLWELHCQRAGGIIGDEMGLGKTVQVSAFLCALERSGLYKPTLVVCPATMLRQWRRELRSWAPRLRAAILHESAVSPAALAAARGNKKRARLGILRDCASDPRGVLLTTYEHMRQMRDEILPVRWGYAVLDEGHKIRNPDADVTICAKQLQTVHRLIMTGAPIQNRLSELWSLFDFCFPGKLGTLPVFQAQFSVPIQVGGYTNASQQQVITAYRCATMLKDLISPFLLRRMKADVDIELPAKTEQVLFCPMTSEQREAYRAYLHSRDVEEILEGRREALGGIDVLRKIVNHPDLLERSTNAAHANYGESERSGKQLVTMKVLGLWKEQGHRALLFSQTQQMLDILEAAVAAAGYVYRRMDGTTPVSHRMRLIDEFNSDARVFVFLLTTKVGGLGVNLTGADRVLLYDPDWNPSTDAQARERAWRIGQTKEVTVYRLVTAGTIEEKVYHRQIYKEFLTSKVLRDPKQRRFFKAKDLADLFTWDEDDRGGGASGADAAIETAELFAEVEGEITAADLADAPEDADPRDDAREDGEVPGANAADPWDPNAEDASRATDERQTAPEDARQTVPQTVPPRRRFTVARAPESALGSPRPDGGGDAAIMRTLFGVGGGVENGTKAGAGDGSGTMMIRGAMNHDAIMSAPGGRDHLAGGSAAAEADRVARRAQHAVRQSALARGSSNIAVPTWTGRSGAAGAPPGIAGAGSRRFGRVGASAGGIVIGTGTGTGTGSGVAAGVAGAGGARGGMGSQTLLQRIRQRDAAAGAAAAAEAEQAARSNGGDGGADDAEAESLLREICAFLRARPGGRAPTGLVVDAFQDRVDAQKHALFRRLLKVAATLERNPPNASGRGGGSVWALKPEFRRA